RHCAVTCRQPGSWPYRNPLRVWSSTCSQAWKSRRARRQRAFATRSLTFAEPSRQLHFFAAPCLAKPPPHPILRRWGLGEPHVSLVSVLAVLVLGALSRPVFAADSGPGHQPDFPAPALLLLRASLGLERWDQPVRSARDPGRPICPWRDSAG